MKKQIKKRLKTAPKNMSDIPELVPFELQLESPISVPSGTRGFRLRTTHNRPCRWHERTYRKEKGAE